MFSRALASCASAAHTVVKPSPAVLRTTLRAAPLRNFQTTSRRMDVPVAAIPVRKPVGAFRGGIVGFLLGSTAAGAGVYYYILEEYRVSNQLLTEDIYSLRKAVTRIETYVHGLEDEISVLRK